MHQPLVRGSRDGVHLWKYVASNCASDVDVLPNGEILIADREAGWVRLLDMQGNLCREVASLDQPYSAALLPRNTLLVAETGKKRVVETTADKLVDSGLVVLEALTYIRGRSISGQFLVVDEAQNLTPHEVKTIVSRAGEDTKMVLTGDPYQIDNPYLDSASNGLVYAAERLKESHLVGHMVLNKSERSELASLAADRL